jgi:ElaB/YqjD/DUF883 family membrane-anchored ribosome-binding protein
MAQGTEYSSEKNSAAHDLRDQAADQFSKVADTVGSAAHTVAERGREAGAEVQAVAANLKTAVDSSVKDQPMATLAVAAALGFVLGAIWKR